MPQDKPRIVVLISGSGSNLQAIIDATRLSDTADKYIPASIVAVISNRPNAYGLKRAARAGIETQVVDHTAFKGREAFDQQLATVIDSYQPDFVILAGFMRILTADFVNRFLGRLINIHPSLLPKYPGLNTHQRAIDAGDKIHGASVHFVTPELDAGPVIIQGFIDTRAGESAEDLANRVLLIEHQIYPLATKMLAQGMFALIDGLTVMKNEPLPPHGYLIDYNSTAKY